MTRATFLEPRCAASLVCTNESVATGAGRRHHPARRIACGNAAVGNPLPRSRCWTTPQRQAARTPGALRLIQDLAADDVPGRDPPALLLGRVLDRHLRRRSSENVR
ncbi:hypothetical protein GCM10027451_29590 [Geodermatophilus aquaeductus]